MTRRTTISFRDLIERRVLLFDGGMGTALYSRGVFLNRCYEELNLERPELVEEVHLSFMQAGADAIETNTFAASRPRLEQHGLGGKVRDVNRAGAEIARRAAGQRVLVAGSVGPLGIRLEPWGPTTADEAFALFVEQMQGLVEGGVDLLVIETLTDLVEVQAAVRAARSVSDVPVIAMMTTDGEGRTPEGVPAEWFTRKLEETEADVIGVNCSVGPAPMLSVIETMAGITDRPLAAMPNAGLPRGVDGRMHYLTSPVYLGRYAKRFAAAGARIVGGCCGVMPEHIRAMREALATGASAQAVPRVIVERPRAAPRSPVARELKSSLARSIGEGRFATLVAVDPPRGWDAERLLESLGRAGAAGFSAAIVTSDPRQSGRLSPLAAARLVLDASGPNGFEPVLQYMARDRRLTDVVSDLLGAHALGLRNVMLITGQAPRPGESSWEAPVFDVDAIGLTNVVTRLNHGLDVGDNPIGDPTAFFTGVLASCAAPEPEEEIRRLGWKVDAGAEFIVTEPVFDAADLERFLAAIEEIRVPVIAAVEPLESARHAEHLAAEVPGIRVPPPIVGRMGDAGGDAEAGEGLEIAREIVEAIGPHVEGVVLTGPRALDLDAWGLVAGLHGTRVAVRRRFRGRPGVKGGSEGSRYDGTRPASS